MEKHSPPPPNFVSGSVLLQFGKHLILVYINNFNIDHKVQSKYRARFLQMLGLPLIHDSKRTPLAVFACLVLFPGEPVTQKL